MEKILLIRVFITSTVLLSGRMQTSALFFSSVFLVFWLFQALEQTETDVDLQLPGATIDTTTNPQPQQQLVGGAGKASIGNEGFSAMRGRNR